MTALIIGTGAAAQSFLDLKQLSPDTLSFATSEGGGRFQGQEVLKLSDVPFERYERVVICSQYIDQIYRTLLDLELDSDKIFYFNSNNQTVLPISELAEKVTQRLRKEMLAIFDLAQYNLSFNFSIFVNNAAAFAKANGYDGIVFVVLEGAFNHGGFHSAAKYSADQNHWRINQLFHPVAEMCDLCSGFAILRNAQQLTQFQRQYAIEHQFPANAVQQGIFTDAYESTYAAGGLAMFREVGIGQTFRSQKQALAYVDDFMGQLNHNKIITLSIRSTNFQSEKNSSVDEWAKLNRYLVKRGYITVLVEDILTALTDEHKARFEGALFFPVASFNVHMRMALYERALFNISSASGASTLLYYNKNVRFMAFLNELLVLTEAELERNTGVKFGQNYDYLGDFQRVYWQIDTFENMRAAFSQWENKLEQLL